MGGFIHLHGRERLLLTHLENTLIPKNIKKTHGRFYSSPRKRVLISDSPRKNVPFMTNECLLLYSQESRHQNLS